MSNKKCKCSGCASGLYGDAFKAPQEQMLVKLGASH